tara:strand:+ start:1782 stop:2444 length:663 start_codon:yes stop_codon:yes gene_type:complete
MSNFAKDTFFEEFFTKDIKSNSDDESSGSDNDLGKRIMTFGTKPISQSPTKKLSDSESSIDSDGFISMKNEDSDQGEDNEVQQILSQQKDTNIINNWNYSPDSVKDSEWEFAYKILKRMKMKEHWVKTQWKWDDAGLELPDDFTNTLNHAIVSGLVTLTNPVNLELEVYKVICKIPKEEARKMYKLNLHIPSEDWILRSKWSWLTCVPYNDSYNNTEAIV